MFISESNYFLTIEMQIGQVYATVIMYLECMGEEGVIFHSPIL